MNRFNWKTSTYYKSIGQLYQLKNITPVDPVVM